MNPYVFFTWVQQQILTQCGFENIYIYIFRKIMLYLFIYNI